MATPTNTIVDAGNIAREVFEKVRPVRALGLLARYELIEGFAGDYGVEREVVGYIENDDDGQPVLLRADGSKVESDAEDGLPSARDACMSARAMRAWYPEMMP